MYATGKSPGNNYKNKIKITSEMVRG